MLPEDEMNGIKCKICKNSDVKLIYKGKIRNGALGKYTSEDVSVYQCEKCKVIWHKSQIEDIQQFYESAEYRISLEGSIEEDRFYELHDKENIDKFRYTGTEIFRNKIVMDIGAGCGSFLDFVKGAAEKIIAVEPSDAYREIMEVKGFLTFAYAGQAQKEWKEKVDIITSFDVIEHVENPIDFLKDVFILLKKGGKGIIGTPTDAPVMRKILGGIYEKQLLYSTQHLWIFSDKSLKFMAETMGFQSIKVKYFQRYGIGNLMGWLRDKEPCSDISGDFITNTLDDVWKDECCNQGLSDYIVLYVQK